MKFFSVAAHICIFLIVGILPAFAQVAGSPQEFTVQIGDRVFFEDHQAELSPEERARATQQAGWLKRNSRYNLLIEGHADEGGSNSYNIALGARRAQALRQILVAEGVPANRFRATSYGRNRPVAVCPDDSCKAQNRRAVIILSDTSRSGPENDRRVIRATAHSNEKQNEFLPLMRIGEVRPGTNAILFIWSATDGESTKKFRNIIWPAINSPKQDRILVIFMQTVTDFTESEIDAAAPFFCGSKDQYDEASMRFLATGRTPEQSPQCRVQTQGTSPQSSPPDAKAIMYASWYVLRSKYGKIKIPALIINGKYYDINSAEDALKYIR